MQATQAARTRSASSHSAAPARSAGPARNTGTGRRSRARAEVVHPPLGSLTQRELRPGAHCHGCGSLHVTRLSMNLTDGTPVDFTSCHHCEHRTWEHRGVVLTRQGVLAHAQKV